MTTAISTITPEQLHAAQLCGHRPALLDVRTAAEYRAGHIPAAPVEYSMQRNHADPTLWPGTGFTQADQPEE